MIYISSGDEISVQFVKSHIVPPQNREFYHRNEPTQNAPEFHTQSPAKNTTQNAPPPPRAMSESRYTHYTPSSAHTQPTKDSQTPDELRDAPALVLDLLQKMEADPASASASANQLRSWMHEREAAMPALLHYARMGSEETRRELKHLIVDTSALNTRVQAKIDEATRTAKLQSTLTELVVLHAYRCLASLTCFLAFALAGQILFALYGSPWVLPPLATWALPFVAVLWLGTLLRHMWLVTVRKPGFELSSCSNDEHVEQLLRDGVIRLLSCEWLRSSDVKVLRRRQEMPDAAFLSPARAAEVWREQRRLVAVLSYRWLTALDPDPHGAYLSTLREFLPTASAVRMPKCAPLMYLHPCPCGLFPS